MIDLRIEAFNTNLAGFHVSMAVSERLKIRREDMPRRGS